MDAISSPSKSTNRLSPKEYESFRQRSESVLQELLAPQNRSALEQFRFQGSTNRVYKIPLAGTGGEFVVVKLPAPRQPYSLRMLKGPIRNFLYGEHGVDPGNKRAEFEIDRYQEWEQAGLNIPCLIRTSAPGVRVIQGLPYPTFYTLLHSQDITSDEKLEVLAHVTRSLAAQHEVALDQGRKGLVHGYPGPWNIMFDRNTATTYWYDLEHPDEYPRMTMHALMVRGLRIFINGVLDPLEGRFEDVVHTIAMNYPQEAVLHGVAESMSNSRAGRLVRLLKIFGLAERNYYRQRRLVAVLTQTLQAKASSGVAVSS